MEDLDAKKEIEKWIEMGLVRYVFQHGEDGLTLTPYGVMTMKFMEAVYATREKTNQN